MTPQSALMAGSSHATPSSSSGVVVAVDQVGDGQIGEGGEAVGDAGRNEHPGTVVLSDVHAEGGPVGGRPLAEIVQHDPRRAPGAQPVVGLMEVVVEADDGAGLLVGAVALHHLAAERKP